MAEHGFTSDDRERFNNLVAQVAKLDERTKAMKHDLQKQIDDFKDEVRGDIDNIRKDLEKYVTKVEFSPIKALVFTGVGATMMVVLTGVLQLVVAK